MTAITIIIIIYVFISFIRPISIPKVENTSIPNAITIVLHGTTIGIRNNYFKEEVQFWILKNRTRARRVYFLECGRLERKGLLSPDSVILS